MAQPMACEILGMGYGERLCFLSMNALPPGLTAMIKRRSAIELMIRHMKAHGKLGRNWFTWFGA